MSKLFNRYTLLLVFSTALALLFLKEVPGERRIARVLQHGQLVPVDVLQSSAFTLGNRTQSYLDFRYAGQVHSIRVSRAFRHQVNATPTASLRHLPEYHNLFLPPDYEGQSTSFYVLTALFLASAVYSLIMLIRQKP